MAVLLLEALRCCLFSNLVAGRGGGGPPTLDAQFVPLPLPLLLPLPLPLLLSLPLPLLVLVLPLLLLLLLPLLLVLLSCFMRWRSPGLLSPSAARLRFSASCLRLRLAATACCASRRQSACITADILALFSGLASKR
jgi:hypothetical protein